MLVGGFTLLGLYNVFLRGADQTVSLSFSLPTIRTRISPQSFNRCLTNKLCENILLSMSNTWSLGASDTLGEKANIRVTLLIYACWHPWSTGSLGTPSVRKDLLQEKREDARAPFEMTSPNRGTPVKHLTKKEKNEKTRKRERRDGVLQFAAALRLGKALAQKQRCTMIKAGEWKEKLWKSELM